MHTTRKNGAVQKVLRGPLCETPNAGEYIDLASQLTNVNLGVGDQGTIHTKVKVLEWAHVRLIQGGLTDEGLP